MIAVVVFGCGSGVGWLGRGGCRWRFDGEEAKIFLGEEG